MNKDYIIKELEEEIRILKLTKKRKELLNHLDGEETKTKFKTKIFGQRNGFQTALEEPMMKPPEVNHNILPPQTEQEKSEELDGLLARTILFAFVSVGLIIIIATAFK